MRASVDRLSDEVDCMFFYNVVESRDIYIIVSEHEVGLFPQGFNQNGRSLWPKQGISDRLISGLC